MKVNGDKEPKVAQKHEVSGYPAIVFLDAEGAEVSRIGGYVPPAPFLTKVKRIVKLPAARAKLKETPDDPAALEVVGEDLLDSGKFDEARASYEKLVAADPDDKKGFGAKAHFQLGLVALFSKNDDAKAAEEFKKVKELDPTDARGLSADIAYFGLKTFAAKKDLEGLLAAAKTYLTTYPKSGHYDEVAIMIGKVQYHLGKKTDAIATWEQFLKEHEKSAAADEAKALIEHVKGELSGAGKAPEPGPKKDGETGGGSK